MTVEAHALFGREQEMLAVDRFLTAVEESPAALVLQGEAGIGKTLVFEHAIEKGRRRGYRILTARPTRPESTLSFVGLTDLLSDAAELFYELPPPQRRALEVALLNEEEDTPPDPRAIGMGLLGVLRAMAASGSVLAAVDDWQWLDGPSAAALSFALRRATTESIGLLAAMRTGTDVPTVEVVGALTGERLCLAPLSVGAIHALLSERLGLSIPRSLLLRIHEVGRGNPLFALEIGRALQERGLPELGRPFEIPGDAEALFAARLDQLSDGTVDALAVAAAMAAPTRSLVSSVSAGGIEPAVRADVIRLEGERIRFTHPLLASAAYNRLDSASRQDLHRRIAEAVTDREERARHLALAADKPDDEVAAALDAAADQAARRGAPAAAAELAELAVQLTPPAETVARRARMQAAAEQHYFAGDALRSREILERLVEELPPGVQRARALLTLAETHSGHLNAALPLREQAVVEAVGDERVLVDALREVAHTLFVAGKPVDALARTREAVAAAERLGDTRLLAITLAYLAWLEIMDGKLTPGLLERALELEDRAGYLRFYESPALIDGVRLMLLEADLDRARDRLRDAEEMSRHHGDEEARALVLANLAQLEVYAGRFEEAVALAEESKELREQFGLGTGPHLFYVALAEALRGHVDAAEAAAEEGLALCEETGTELFIVRNLFVLGLLALSRGEATTAARILGPLPARLALRGYGRVNVLQVLPDAVEALIAAGDLDQAAAQLEKLEKTARTLGIAYAEARAARCRGLLAAAKRDYGAALEAFEDAVVAHERLADPLERGRTLLALGLTQRRTGRRRDAREALRQALAIFEEIGAELWTKQARAELERLGGRTPAGSALTGAEERVAHLVAEGKTNREVAAALFVTERTVETHLSSIYRKLELRSRSELTRYLAGGNGERSS